MAMAGFCLTAGLGLLMSSLVSCDVIYDVTSGDVANYTLPSSFLFGAGNSNYQIEGAWNVSGKGESVLDYGYNHNSRFTATGNEACDSYHHIDEDIEVIRQLQLNVYRFSLSWPRIFPNGTRPANEDGVRYYKELIRKLRNIGVEPLITLYHFDHPRIFETQFHSWQSETMIDMFVDFADFAFETFGENVTYWTTINEANQYCNLVHFDGLVPPGDESETGLKQYYVCMRNMMIAHGKAYRVYQQKYASSQNGKVGFSCLAVTTRPASTTQADIAASIRANDFGVAACTEPVILGDWPSSVKNSVISQLVKEYNLTSLYFSETETAMLTDSTDYMGLNVYAGLYVKESGSSSGFFVGANVTLSGFTQDSGWPIEDSILYVNNNYNNLPVFVTENGLDTASEGMDDTSRATYASCGAGGSADLCATGCQLAGYNDDEIRRLQRRYVTLPDILVKLLDLGARHSYTQPQDTLQTFNGGASTAEVVIIQVAFKPSVHAAGLRKKVAYALSTGHKKVHKMKLSFCYTKFDLRYRKMGKFQTNLRAVAGVINSCNASVIGYTMWSLLDDFEYSSGYRLKYGMVHVDFDSINKTRTLKSSSKFFTLLQSTRVVPAVKESKSANGAGVLLRPLSFILLALNALILSPSFNL